MWTVVFEGPHQDGRVRTETGWDTREKATWAFWDLTSGLKTVQQVETYTGETFDEDRKLVTGTLPDYEGPVSIEMFFKRED
jgi:hypothetical protein